MRAVSESHPPTSRHGHRRGSGGRTALSIVRVPVALGLIGLGGMVAFDRVVSTVGVNGTLTGPVLPIVAPIDGTVMEPRLEIGTYVEGGERLLDLKNAVFDRQVLARLMREAAAKAGELSATEERIAVLEEMHSRLASELDSHLNVAVSRLRLGVRVALARIDAATARHVRAKDELERLERISEGFVSKARRDAVRADVDVAAAEIRAAEMQRDRLASELAAAERGIYSNSGYFDTPYPARRADEITLRLMDERARRTQLQVDLAELREQVDRERQRIRSLTGRTLQSPGSGMIWNASVASGSEVRAGQVVAEVASCTGLFVEVPLSEGRIDDVRIGMDVLVEFTGSDEAVPGRVRSLRGAGAAGVPEGRAAQVDKRSRGMMMVSVSVDADELADALGSGCHIGRTAKVRFGTATEFVDAAVVVRSFFSGARELVSVLGRVIDTTAAASADAVSVVPLDTASRLASSTAAGE